MGENTEYASVPYPPGTMSHMGFDLSRITVIKHDNGDDAPWMVWIPPTGPESFADGDIKDGDLIDEFGESFWQTWQDACGFVQRVLDTCQIDSSEET